MTDPRPSTSLLEEAAWVRSLARRLARDASTADDLAQETLAAAIERPPRPDRPLRRWLAAVLRNFARQRHRSETRRLAREVSTARREGLPSTAELVDRLAAQRAVADAVVALEEPYRTAILLRFYEGLPPRAIARRQGVPVETVKTRIQRGLERLRVRLDRAFGGDRRAWLLALAPFWKPSFLAAPPTIGTALMQAKAKISLAAALLLAPLAVWVALPDREESPAPTASALPESSVSAAPRSADPTGAAASEPARRMPLQANAPGEAPPRVAASPAPQPAPLPLVVHGRVLDELGHPRAGVRVELRAKEAATGGPQATSGPEGRFEMETTREAGRIFAVDPAVTTVLSGAYEGFAKGEAVVVVAPRLSIDGRAEDEEGVPVAGARASVELPDAFRTRFREILDASADVHWLTETGSEGTFTLPAAPAIEGARFRVAREGFLTHDEPVPASDTYRVVILRKPSGDRHVRGRVVAPDGRPAEDARVALGMNTTRTDLKGEFVFPLDDPESFNARLGLVPRTLVAVKPGYLPASFEAPTDAGGSPAWPASVTLRLGGTPLAIAGRVVDPRSEPLEGMSVWLADPTLFGALERGLRQVEGLLASEEARAWHSVTTDARGHFRIEGLLPRSYRLRAMDPATLLRTEDGPFAAGEEGVLLRMPSDGLYERVAGRVLSRSGKPVGGAEVFPMCDAFRTEVKPGMASTSHASVEGTRTDAEGRFELRRVPKNLVYLRIEGEGLIPLEYGRGGELPADRIERLEITVDRRCHFKVELTDPAAADEVAVLDAEGNELILNIFVGDGRRENERAPIAEGLSHTLAVSDAGRTLVLYLQGKEVGRVPLALEPGEMKEIRW
jgi:RNA polymerase sigma-70 factor (ECF subfamily)